MAFRPRDALRRQRPLAGGSPSVIPVLFRPWEAVVSRRTFLGTSIPAVTALALDKTALSPIPSPAAEYAATQAQPRLLSMVGIEASATESVEQGYHLRWFSEIPLPPQVAPSRAEAEEFLAATGEQPLAFGTAGATKGEAKGKDVNPGVPNAFLIYRRVHEKQPRFTHKQEFSTRFLAALRQTNRRSIEGEGVAATLRSTSLDQLAASVWARSLLGDAGWPRGVRTSIDWLTIRFQDSSGRERAVHALDLVIPAQPAAAGPLLLLGFGEDPDEPVRTAVLDPRKRSHITWVQGHYYRLELIAKTLESVHLRFMFMDEDTRLAKDPDKPLPGEWVLVASIPFLTAFRSWEAARGEYFRHPVKNRYLEFGGPLPASDWVGRLNVKYGPQFAELQRALVRARYADMVGLRYLQEDKPKVLTSVKHDPRRFLQIWAMDPLVASLLSQRFVDAPGPGSSRPPETGTVYDYMVTTAWQPPAQRLCYIAQRISAKSTPPLKPPAKLTAAQESGSVSEGGAIQYRCLVRWDGEGTPASDGDFGYYEAPFYDVRRLSDGGPAVTLTHYFDPAAPATDSVVDSPFHAPISVPESNAPGLSKVQRDALSLRATLHKRDSTRAITATQVEAYRGMRAVPLSEFFGLRSTKAEFTDWVPLATTAEKSVIEYAARAIDLFGRVSAWSESGSIELRHSLATPAAEDVKVRERVDATGGRQLAVSWKLNPLQVVSGAPLDHCEVVWRPVNRERDFALAIYHDLLGTTPPALEALVASLRSGPTTRASLIATLCTSSAYAVARGFGSASTPQDDRRFIGAVFQDLLRRQPRPAEMDQWLDGLASGAPRGDVVNQLLKSPEYRPPNTRRYRFWKDNVLAGNVPFVPPVLVTVEATQTLGLCGSSATGGASRGAGVLLPVQIVAQTHRSDEASVVEEIRVLGCRRLLTLVTDQCFHGLSPFVDAPSLYPGAGRDDLLDSVKLRAGAQSYDVVRFQGGDSLTVGVAISPPAGVPETDFDPQAEFVAATSGASLELEFESYKTCLAWEQNLSRQFLPDAPAVASAPGTPGGMAGAQATGLGQRTTLRLTVSSPFAVETTGREAWLTRSAFLSYADENGQARRVSVLEAGLLRLSHGELRFGRCLAPASETMPALRTATLRNTSSSPLLIESVETDNPAFVVVSPSAGTTLLPGGELVVRARFEPAQLGDATGTLTLETPVGALTLLLFGEGVGTLEDVSLDATPTRPRSFLSEVTLAAQIHSGTAESEDENPSPIFTNAMLLAALKDVSELTAAQKELRNRPMELHVPGLALLTFADPTASGGAAAVQTLTGSRGGALTLSQGDNEADGREVWPLASRPVLDGTGRPLALVSARPDDQIPWLQEALWFHPLYETVAAVPADMAATAQAVEVAVAGRRTASPPTEDELDALVSLPARVRHPSARPSPPLVPAFTDFEIDFAGVPKKLDNREVYQYRLDLTDSVLMKGQPFPSPAQSAIEVFRAPADAIRLLMSHQQHPVDPSVAGDEADPTPEEFNKKTDDEVYAIVARRLLITWGDATYSPTGAFSRIGLIEAGASPRFIDEIQLTGPTDVFYAVRAVRPGARPTSLQLLPFRLRLPDLTPPPIPSGLRIESESGYTIVSWRTPDKSGIQHRVYFASANSGPRALVPVADLTAAAVQSDPRAHHPPLRARRVEQDLRPTDGRLSPWFPPKGFREVRGVFERDRFDPLAMPLMDQSIRNLFDQSTGSQYVPSANAIEGIQPADQAGLRPRVAVVYSRTLKLSITLPWSVENHQLRLPSPARITGVYRPSSLNTSAQTVEYLGPNLWIPSSRWRDNYVLQTAAQPGDSLTVEFEDTNYGFCLLPGLIARRLGCLVLPFGPAARVKRLFAADDSNRSTDLMSHGAHYLAASHSIQNIGLPDGVPAVVDFEVADDDWAARSSDCAVYLPTAVAPQQVAGLLVEPPLDPGADLGRLIAEGNAVSGPYVIIGSTLRFPSTIADSTRVGIVVRNAAGDLALFDRDERYLCYREPQRSTLGTYGIASLRRVAVAETVLSLLSAPVVAPYEPEA